MEEGQVQLVVFRLDQVETSIEEMSGKLDLLLVNQHKYWTQVALTKQAQQDLEKRVAKLESKSEELQAVSSDLKVGMAGKLGPGAVAGAITSAVMLLLKFIAGA